MQSLVVTLVLIQQTIGVIKCDNFDVLIDAKATSLHRIDSLNLLIYCESLQKSISRDKNHFITTISGSLLALTVLTIWIFKYHRVSWLNETGLAVIYGKKSLSQSMHFETATFEAKR